MQTAVRHLASLCSRNSGSKFFTLHSSLFTYSLFTYSLFTLLLVFTSCYREPLELYTNGDADVTLTFDWETRYHERPEGMTLMLAHDGDQISLYDPTHNIDTWRKGLVSGLYLLTVMNKTFAEYGTMKFYNRSSHNDLLARSNTYYISAENQWDHGRTYIEEPERIGVATDTFRITNTIDSLIFYDYRCHVEGDTVHMERHNIVEPMTTTLTVTVKVRGINYMREGGLQGYITGMADGFWLNRRWRNTDVGTLKLDNWHREDTQAESRRRGDGEQENNVGWMTTTVETFGLPHGKELLRQRTPESNYILLHFTLIDGRTKDFAYLVGQDIHYRGDDGTLEVFDQTDVTLELNLEIDTPYYDNDEVPILPYSQPEGSGQFDAEVAPWGDDVDVDIPL